MKMKVQYCESFRAFLRYDKYTIDTDNFPELENLDYEYVTQWVVKNSENLSVKYEGGELEIVPYDSNLAILADTLTEGGIQSEKTTDSENWFEYLGDDDEDDDEDEESDEDEDEELDEDEDEDEEK
jgi:hypothetical protein